MCLILDQEQSRCWAEAQKKKQEMKEIKAIINECCRRSSDILNELYNSNGRPTKTFLGIPSYQRNAKLRISEQELRFVFVNQLEEILKEETLSKKGNDRFYYYVEEPTKDRYRFSKNGHLLDSPRSGEGQSANFDLTIENNQFKVLIEFKAKTATPFSYKKDFCKLWNPKEKRNGKDTLRFFINVFENTPFDKEKYQKFIDSKIAGFLKEEKRESVEVIGIFLRKGKADIISFVE